MIIPITPDKSSHLAKTLSVISDGTSTISFMNTVRIPDAMPALSPFELSSTIRHSDFTKPVFSADFMNISGSGLPLVISSPPIIPSKYPSMPECSSSLAAEA